MKLTSYTRWALALALPFAASTGYAISFAPGMPGASSTSVGGIVAPSFPNFLGVNDVVTVQKFGTGAANTYWHLEGNGSTSILMGSNFKSYNVDNDKVHYEANFDSTGKLITSQGSNFLTINGSLTAGKFGNTSWGPVSDQLLLSANLLDVNPGNGTADKIGTFGSFALGFNTKWDTTNPGWAALNPGLTGGSTGESLWLAGISSNFANLVKALDGNTKNGDLDKFFSLTDHVYTIKGVFSVASVPVPGAVWLFGTGLMTLLASRRKGVVAKLVA